MRVLSSLNVSPRGASHAASRCLTCSACSREEQSATRSSAYLTRTGVPGTDQPRCDGAVEDRAPAAVSIPCRAMFISNGLMTPPTQLAMSGSAVLRVGLGAAVGRAVTDRD